MDHRTPEMIEAEMASTRQSLTEKVAALEDTVVGTVQSASDAVKETVSSVRSAVEDTVESVKDNVESVLDVSGHVRRHPWAMVGGAAAAGFLAGFVLPRSGGSPLPAAHVPTTVPTAPTARGHGFLDSLVDRFSAELHKVGEAAVASLSGIALRAVNDHLPRLVDRLLEPAPRRAPEDGSSHPIGRWSGSYAG